MIKLKGIIQISVKKIIDNQAQSTWDRYVFDDTYQEFLLQSQFYNQEKKFTTFREIIERNPVAQKLNFLVSAAILPYLAQLNNILYDIPDLFGNPFLKFTGYKFEIVDSSIKDKSLHRIALTLISEEITWLETIDTKLLVAAGNIIEQLQDSKVIETQQIILPINAMISRISYT